MLADSKRERLWQVAASGAAAGVSGVVGGTVVSPDALPGAKKTPAERIPTKKKVDSYMQAFSEGGVRDAVGHGFH